MTSALLGWSATVIFVSSYFARSAATLKRIQAVAACLWIMYGVNIDAPSVVVANIVLAAIALYSSFSAKFAWHPQWAARINRSAALKS